MESAELITLAELNVMRTRLSISIDDLEQNNPNRTDLIDNLKESLNTVVKSRMLIKSLIFEKELSEKLAFDNEVLRHEKDVLQNKINKLKENINL